MEVESLSVTVGAIHTRLEALVRDNVESSKQAGRGKGSSTYQTRQNVTGALLNKLEKRRKEISDLEERVVSDGREIIRRRFRHYTCLTSSPSLKLSCFSPVGGFLLSVAPGLKDTIRTPPGTCGPLGLCQVSPSESALVADGRRAIRIDIASQFIRPLGYPVIRVSGY